MTLLRFVVLTCLVAWAGAAQAGRATLVVDAKTGKVLSHSNATARLHPASLTKMMTAYLTLEAMKAGKLKADEPLKVSTRASAQGGATLGLDRGKTITASDALTALIVRSANDAAVVLAERIGSSEENFAAMMTEKARSLGMTGTSFANASGMTAVGHLTTARDMAVLALALERDFPRHRDLFSRRGLNWGNQWLPSVNGFLSRFQGADGMKTGFTCAAGYNLVGSATRGDRRLIGVEMGASTKEERQTIMRRILDDAFAGRTVGTGISLSALKEDVQAERASLHIDACLHGVPGVSSARVAGKDTKGLKGWALDVGISLKERQARAMAAKELSRLRKSLGGGRVATVLRAADGMISYRALIVDVDEKKVIPTCLAMRGRGEDCLVLNPLMLAGAVEDADRYARYFAE